ncbi:dynein axonemal assembly factor 4-like [Lineus longissimus]|uniref:dynein axonemal assembly factor 4-like n=1 Tax=Lineus longissimus TaxID=88925 RepID=UPI002B4DEF63
MPIAVKDYTWDQTESSVNIVVPLKGAKSNKVDVLSTEKYLKVSYPPYFFECLLFAPVDDDKSSAQIGNGAVLFRLQKQEVVLWDQLYSTDYADKEKMKEIRSQALEDVKMKAEQRDKEKVEKKREREKYALKEAMKLDEDEREKIRKAKELERKLATDDLERWKDEQRQAALKEKERLQIERKKDIFYKELVSPVEKKIPEKNKEKGSIFEEATGAPKREPGMIEVTFTPRVFPTAARESVSVEEQEWLKKQVEAQRIKESEDKDLSEEERNPLWLRDKGNSFFKAGDFQAAINAYSHAIRLDSKMPALFSNRAACHLKIGNMFKCIEDCSKSLELLTPPVPQNAASRCKAHIRRGTAFCQLELYVEGLMDYEAALKIDPKNEQIRQDAEKMRQLIQGTEAAES